jgi:hypothetical protein
MLGGCGQSDFDRDPPRPPVVIQVTGVITSEKVTVSPSRIGGGMVVLIVSNQDEDSHTVILEGVRTREQVGPINPQDTATVTARLTPGSYAVRAGSDRAVNPSEEIEPARLVVSQRRPTGADDVLGP